MCSILSLCKPATQLTVMKGTHLWWSNAQQLLTLKPIRHVKTYHNSSILKSDTLYTYPDPVSPHIATDKVSNMSMR